MAEEFRVSVVTPVYNAAEFVTRAVESALAQPETGEVLLIEDNSPDNSLRVCRELAEKHEKVRVLRHPDGGNHGAGASRNLGMQNARFDYIGFVDADNFDLLNRFAKTKESSLLTRIATACMKPSASTWRMKKRMNVGKTPIVNPQTALSPFPSRSLRNIWVWS